MSDDDLHARSGKLLEEYSQAKQEAARSTEHLNHIADLLAALAGKLRTSANEAVADPGIAAQILRELPEDLSPSTLRDIIAHHQAAIAKLYGLRAELKP